VIKIKIGIQGEIGSNNHRAAILFAEKHEWSDYTIVPLLGTKNVLSAVESEKVDFGIFAWESSSGGVVKESQQAVKEISFTKVDEIFLDIQHALLIKKGDAVNHESVVHVFSHPQALLEHDFHLKTVFSKFEAHPASDTASAAKLLASDQYPDNSIVISPPICAEIYNLDILENDLPYESDSWTHFYLVQKNNKDAL